MVESRLDHAQTDFDQFTVHQFKPSLANSSGEHSVPDICPEGSLLTVPEQETSSGMAALSICEALLLALNDRNILPESEITGILRDAAATHENALGSGVEKSRHRSAAALINRIIDRRA